MMKYVLITRTYSQMKTFKQYLLEMPQLIANTNFAFDEDGKNHSEVNLLKIHGKSSDLLPVPEGYVLYVIDKGHGEQKFGLVSDTNRLVYALHLSPVHHLGEILSVKPVKQALVWREPSDAKSHRFPAEVFWALFAKFGSFVTDDQQTKSGRSFWLYRLEEAFSKGYFVYYINVESGTLEKISDFNEVKQRSDQFWNHGQDGMNHLLLISKNKVKTQ